MWASPPAFEHCYIMLTNWAGTTIWGRKYHACAPDPRGDPAQVVPDLQEEARRALQLRRSIPHKALDEPTQGTSIMHLSQTLHYCALHHASNP